MSLVLKGVKIAFGQFRLEASLSVSPGEILGIMGPSGAGKTTLFHSISGFFPILEGQIFLGEKNLTRLAPEKRRVALVFQNGSLFPHLNVYQNIEFPLNFQKILPSDKKNRVEEWLNKLDIFELKGRRVHELSGGQAQRVALARAFVTGFPVLLLDEPFTGLDSKLQKNLKAVLRRFVTELKVCSLLISHSIRDLESIANRVAVLDRGRILQEATIEVLRSHPIDERVTDIIH